jgi:hypothetical protein
LANPVQRLWRAIRTGTAAAIANRLSRKELARARALEPALSWQFDFYLKEEIDGPYFTNWRDQRVPAERLRIVAADIDRLLAHVRDPDAGIPLDPGMFRNPWGGQAFAMQDPQFSGATIDVNVARRSSAVEVDIPTGASEEPVRQSIDDLERFAAVVRRMIALWEAEIAKRPATAA